MKRTLYEATDPARVRRKLQECRFFLARLNGCDLTRDMPAFECYRSAFQNAFRTAIYRLTGAVKNLKGTEAKRTLAAELESHGDIAFLKDRADLEIHGDGSPVWPSYTIEIHRGVKSRWASRWQSRFEVKTGTRFGTGFTTRIKVHAYQFEGNPKNVLDLCRDTLADLEAIAERELAGSPTKHFDLATTQRELIDSINSDNPD